MFAIQTRCGALFIVRAELLPGRDRPHARGRRRGLREPWLAELMSRVENALQLSLKRQDRGVMKKVDLKKDLKRLYRASAKAVVEIDVPTFRFLMVDGKGDPNSSPEYAQAVEALFSVSYTAKFMVKKGPQELDYAVMPLEGLWWADDLSAFVANDRASWRWTMMILQPDFVADEVIEAAVAAVRSKKKLPAIDKLRLEAFTEGHCAQILHVGPFSEEGPTIARVHAFIDARSGLAGKHHEIYLSDVRRADPRNWKTIIRQPMR